MNIINSNPFDDFFFVSKETVIDYIDSINNGDDVVRKLDNWVEKILIKEFSVKYYIPRPYPYSKYDQVRSIMEKHGEDLIKKVCKLCPSYIYPKTYRPLERKDEISDSIAWVIWDKKMDINSLIEGIPNHTSLWDKISEDGYEK